jgi:Ser/Thr protein kinase RdoA (MazF antagonist)
MDGILYADIPVEVAAVLRDEYDLPALPAQGRRTLGYSDAVQHIALDSLFLKLWSVEETDETTVHKQAHVTQHVWGATRLRSSCAVAVPRVHATRDGRLFTRLPASASAPALFMCILDAMPGAVLNKGLGGVPMPPLLLAGVGAAAGRVAAALATLDEKAAPQPSAAAAKDAIDALQPARSGYWDLAHAPLHAAHVGAIVDGGVRGAAAAALSAVQALVRPPAETGLTWAWIHGDLHDMNLLLAPGGPAGGPIDPAVDIVVIDFDDASFSLAAAEPAIALAYALMPLLSGGEGAGRPTASQLEGAAAGLGATLLHAFARARPLSEADARAVLPLIRARLATSLTSSARVAARTTAGESSNGAVHAGPAAALLSWLSQGGAAREAALTGAWVSAVAEGCVAGAGGSGYVSHTLASLGEGQVSASEAVIAWLAAQGRAHGFHAVLTCPTPALPLQAVVTACGATPTSPAWASERDGAAWPAPPFVYDFTGGAALSEVAGSAEPVKLSAFTAMMLDPLTDCRGGPAARLGWGRYHEARILYTSDHFRGGVEEPRTLHLGVDIEAPAGTPVHAPLRGVVHSWGYNTADLDYGPCIVLQHEAEGPTGGSSVPFYTLYGHLSLASLWCDAPADEGAVVARGWQAPMAARRWLPRLRVGASVEAGEVFAWLGGPSINGGWPPHVHFQVETEGGMGGWVGDYPGVARASDWPAYALLTPDPNLILRCPWVEPVGAWTP